MLFQLLIGIVIISILASIVALNLSVFRESQALNNGLDEVKTLLNQARSKTQGAENGVVYGVHLESDKAVLFAGDTYTDGAPGNLTVRFDPTVAIDSISLLGGGSDVVFDAITGNTEESGTFIVKRVSTTSGEKTVTVSPTGLIDNN